MTLAAVFRQPWGCQATLRSIDRYGCCLQEVIDLSSGIMAAFSAQYKCC